MFEVESGRTSQDPVEQRKHLSVGVSTSAEQDDAGTVALLKRNEAGVVEVAVMTIRSSRRATASNWSSGARTSPRSTAWIAS